MSINMTSDHAGVFPKNGFMSNIQKRNEAFIGIIQLVLLGCFAGVAYWQSLLDHPYIFLLLTFYASFIALKSILCLSLRLPFTVISVSASIDIVMPLLLIWILSGYYDHLSYLSHFNQGLYFYLLISIGLRVLHYNVGLTFFSAMIALIGLILVSHFKNIFFSSSAGNITNEEIDALVGFSLFSIILTLLAHRSKQLEIKRVDEQTKFQSFSRFFAEGVAQKIKDSKTPLKVGEGEIRESAVLFIDLKGFTKLTQELPPNQIMSLLGDYQTRMVKVIYAHNGDIDKFLGDGIMASFGAVTITKTYASDALKAVDDLLIEVENWKKDRLSKGQICPNIGIGLAVGPVIFGAVGNQQRMEFTLIGDAVNLAAKLEKHTRKQESCFITTRKTLDLAIQQGYEDKTIRKILEKEMIRGFEQPIDLILTV